MCGVEKTSASGALHRLWAGRLLPCVLALACFFAFPQALHAQTVTTYVNTTNGAIDGTTTCTAPLVRNFSVGTSFTVSDVDIGVFVTHTWRGDLRMTLQSPTGTRVQLTNGDTNNISGDNFNVLLNDEGTQTVNTDGNTATHSTAAPPPFQHDFIPNNALTAFDGENSLGTWRLEICDLFPSADNGTFQHAELYLTDTPTNYADLSLTKTVSNSSPGTATAINYTLQVTNAASSPNTATGVIVNDLLPAGVSFNSAAGDGSYDNVTGNWSVGTIAPGQTRTLVISATVNATPGATVTNAAEITASSESDIDSAVNNGANGEDDYDTASFTVSGTRTAGTPPTLICPNGNTIFDWDTRTWTAGSLVNNYSQTNIGNINFNIATTATWLSNATYGGQSPALQNVVTGGLSPAQFSLFLYPDFSTISETVTATITLPTAVDGAQFTVFDIDYNPGQFADRMRVTGTFDGSPVIPTLTNGISNYVIGNEAFGDALSSDPQSNGNVVVTFTSPVDTIIIEYGNHSLSPTNPGGQAIALHDINFCTPDTTLSVTKISQLISDPVNGTTNAKRIPGAIVQYCILISNAGSATATDITATDSIPGDVTFNAGSMRSGTNCGSAATVEDDDATGADESDPFGAGISGTDLTATATSLGPADAFALTFQVTVD